MLDRIDGTGQLVDPLGERGREVVEHDTRCSNCAEVHLVLVERELALLTHVQVIVVLGQFAYDVMARQLGVRPRPKFGHGVEVPVAASGRTVLCSYHPSQQNTFTGKLTIEMFDAVFQRTRALTSPTR